MSSVKRVKTVQLYDAEAVSGNVTSDTLDAHYWDDATMQISWSGGLTPSINVILQGSVDQTNWATIASQAISGTSGTDQDVVTAFGYPYLRVFLDHSSGSANVDVWLFVKGRS